MNKKSKLWQIVGMIGFYSWMIMMVIGYAQAFTLELQKGLILQVNKTNSTSPDGTKAVYSFRMSIEGKSVWLALGATNSSGLGHLFMEPFGKVFSGAVIGRPVSETAEFDLKATNQNGIIRHSSDSASAAAIQKCIFDDCANEALQCSTSNLCPNALICLQTRLSENGTDFTNALGCATDLENDSRELGILLGVSSCYLSKCDQKLRKDLASRSVHISDVVFETSLDETVLSFSAYQIGFVPLDTFNNTKSKDASSFITTLIWAYGDSVVLADHTPSQRGSLSIDLSTGSVEVKQALPSWVFNHAMLMFFGFSIFIPHSIILDVSRFETRILSRNTKIIALILILASMILALTQVPSGRIIPHSFVGYGAISTFIFALVFSSLIPSLKGTPQGIKIEIMIQRRNSRRVFVGVYWLLIYSCVILAGIASFLGFDILESRSQVLEISSPFLEFIGPIILAAIGAVGFFHILLFLYRYRKRMNDPSEKLLLQKETNQGREISTKNPVTEGGEEDEDETWSAADEAATVVSGDLTSSVLTISQQQQQQQSKKKHLKKKTEWIAPNPTTTGAAAAAGEEDDEDLLDPVVPMELYFVDVTFKTPPKVKRFGCLEKVESSERKTILQNISGYCGPRTMTAILGPSGAGKSSLLSLLTRRLIPYEGDSFPIIKLNGKSIYDLPNYYRVTGFVLQQDILFEVLTVFETLYFAAGMVIPSSAFGSTPDRAKDPRYITVMKILSQLRLTHAAKTKVGGDNVRGISGGERRRVSIGIQLISSPSLLFLDEPTSGLDFSSAQQVVSVLRELANEGRTVVCTIHQPSASIFEKFDRLILLSAGKLVYSGSRGGASIFFGLQRYVVPKNWNPADWFIHVVNVTRPPEDDSIIKKTGTNRGLDIKLTLDNNNNRQNIRQSADIDIDATRSKIIGYYKKFNPKKLKEPGAVDAVLRYAVIRGLPALEKKLIGTYGVGIIHFDYSSEDSVAVSSSKDGVNNSLMLTATLSEPLDMKKLDDIVKSFKESRFGEELLDKISSIDDTAANRFIRKSIIQRSDTARIMSILNAKAALIANRDVAMVDHAVSYAQLMPTQVWWLIWRNRLISIRTPEILKAQVFQNIALGIIIGSLYSESQKSSSRAYSVSMALVIILGVISMTTVALQTASAFAEKLVYNREQDDGLYSPTAFFVAKIITQIPINFIIALSLIGVAYFWVGLNPDPSAFLFFVLLNFVFIMLFDGFSSVVSNLAGTLAVAFGIANFYEAVAIFFSGIFIQYPLIPPYYQWIVWLSPFSYAFSAASVNEFEGTNDEFWLDAMGLVWRDKIGNLSVLIGFVIFWRALHFYLISRPRKHLT